MNYLDKNNDILEVLDFSQELSGGLIQAVQDFGKDLPQMWEGLRRQENLLQGCLSTSYFVCELTHEGLIHIEGESNSSVIRGIMGIFYTVLDGETASCVDMERVNWWRASGLMQHLTPQRQGAVRQIVKRIEEVL